MSNFYTDWNRKRCIEPAKRKHGSLTPEWQLHRFEIKGGITMKEALRITLETTDGH